jgi:hypothetical protein
MARRILREWACFVLDIKTIYDSIFFVIRVEVQHL